MNKHSILLKLNIIFSVAIIAVLILAFLMMININSKNIKILTFKSRLILREIRISNTIPYDFMEELGFNIIEDKEKTKVLNNAKRIFLRKANIKILRYENNIFLHLNKKNKNILLKSNHSVLDKILTALLIFIAIISLLIIMYILLRKSIIPLKKLQKDIEKYGNNEKLEYLFINKKDEVSLVSNAFYDSMKKLEKLKSSRELFIKNIFHELNTPITKGKILSEIIKDDKTKTMLDSIFTRLALLLKQLAKSEQITSKNYKLNIRTIRIKEIIDEASDLLYLEQNIQTNIKDETINADFYSMSIVFKNLIDNALKYGENIKITLDNKTIKVISKGKKLNKNLLKDGDAFIDDSNKNGFGLGLYIVGEILSLHSMKLEYFYDNGENVFCFGIDTIISKFKKGK